MENNLKSANEMAISLSNYHNSSILPGKKLPRKIFRPFSRSTVFSAKERFPRTTRVSPPSGSPRKRDPVEPCTCTRRGSISRIGTRPRVAKSRVDLPKLLPRGALDSHSGADSRSPAAGVQERREPPPPLPTRHILHRIEGRIVSSRDGLR